MTKKQIEQVVDILKSIGLASLLGSVADAVLVGGRNVIDAVGLLAGLVTLGSVIWLTKKLNGDKV